MSVGSVATKAADLSGQQTGGSFGNYAQIITRVEPVIIYDYEPGIIIRDYWDTPWGYRHYFPRTGHRPKVGRLERVPRHHLSKAEDYYRFWSVSSVFSPQAPLFAERPYAGPPALPPGSRY